MKHIAILDFGSQYTHLIARNIRDLNVLATIHPADTKAENLKEAYGVILSGGPQSVYGENSIKVDPGIFEMDIPVLGLCYGHQLMGHLLGGKVEKGTRGEYGKAVMKTKGETEIFKNVTKESVVWMSHGDSVTELPEDFSCIGSTDDCEITAMANEEERFYGFQFHPEVMHTQQGEKMLENFVLGICRAKKEWKVTDLVDELIEKIKKQVGDKKVFILVSGGVDSNVAFALLTKALGEDRVKGLYIDTGFMRKDESQEIMQNFEEVGFRNLERIDASEKFFARLKNVFDPEEKRGIIGQTFLDVKDEVSKNLGLDPERWILGQGTIYPDTIESGGTKHADKIKTHHNRVDAIQQLIDKGLVVEPLVDFYKDEVRRIGQLLDLPQKLIDRHPFPGPGLAIRILCNDVEKNKENIQVVEKKVDEFFQNNFSDVAHELLPLRSVGVQGDSRTYAHPLVVWGTDDWERLDRISSMTTNTIREVNRVILAVGVEGDRQPKLNLCSESKDLNDKRVVVLQEIDAIVNNIIRQEDIYGEIWQFPVVLVPICGQEEKESVVLRPFNSRDVMTFNFYRMEKRILKRMADEILATGKISYVFYDVTNKSPGTTEWE